MLIFAALPVLSPVAMDLKIVSVDRKEVFAGRLGRRIEETLTLEKDGKTYRVELGRAHSRMGKTREFRAGESVTVRGVMAGRTVMILRDAVR